MCLRKKKT